ncbi:MAG: RelA/SpoT domain-containing protein [Dehalococcoidia bacterium]|jgi:ppGpp synthetase/RelA/SpoT-type nucleotidyltranferase|nr:RelA/SpoT domain-containing protein [Dehalococcoidia bacterium]
MQYSPSEARVKAGGPMPVTQRLRRELKLRHDTVYAQTEAMDVVIGQLRLSIPVQIVPEPYKDSRINGRQKTAKAIIDKLDREYPERKFRTIEEVDEIVRDICAGKIVVDSANQVSEACEIIRESLLWEICKDEPRRLDSGFRAHKFDLKVRNTSNHTNVWFEVQIRTLLQDAWDYYQHPVYERVRSGAGGKEAERQMRWVSEMFFTIDDMIEHCRQEIDYGQ